MSAPSTDGTYQLQRLVQMNLVHHQAQTQHGLLWITELTQGEAEIDFVHWHLAAAQVLFWTPGQVCRFHLQQVSGWWLHFGLDFLCQSGLNDLHLATMNLFAPLQVTPLLNISPTEQALILPWWQAWHTESQAVAQPYQRQLQATYLRLILLHCGRLAAARNKLPLLRTESNELVSHFQQLLEQHFKHWHQVSEYAQHLAVTPGHLNGLVKQATGRSAKQLIQERRMLAARRAAWFSQASLKEIAYDLGFEDPAYFSRLFRRCSGESFTAFRERIHNLSKS